jgi:NAD(P)-dependent dehydrogenase (short-subunit alcohol dehydrogenase family)
MSLENRAAIVTGGSSGIGRGICLELAREGARVVVADIQEEPKQGIYHEQDLVSSTVSEIKKIGADAFFVQLDVADEGAVASLITTTTERFGGLDILVNNAGIHIPGTTETMPSADWDRVVGINLRALFLTSKYAIPHLKRSRAGRIINIASIHAFGGGGGPAYASAKAGVVNMTRNVAIELGAASVTANAICPGYIETPIQDYLTTEQIEWCREKTPLPRLGRPRDIGRACVFFASDDAEWITGTSLTVDGGWTASVG